MEGNFQDNKKFSAIKGRFQSVGKKFYGIFYFILNQEANSVDTASVVVSLYSQVYEISLSEPIAEFENRITQIKTEGQYALSATQSLQESFKNISQDYSFYREIEAYITANDAARLKPILKSFFSRVLEDNSITIDIQIQNVSEDEIRLDSSNAQETQQGDEEKDISSLDESEAHPLEIPQEELEHVLLDINFVLAPVGGKLVTNLQVGQKVMVRILPNTDKANYYINQYKLKTESNQILPIPGEIKSIKEDDGNIEVVARIEENVFGKVVEEERVLVRMFDPHKFQDLAGMSKQKQFGPTSSRGKVSRTPSAKEKNSSVALIIGVISLFILIFSLFYLLSSL